MQNLTEQKKQFQTIFVQRSQIKLISKRPEKKLLRHYLATIENMTQTGFFKYKPQRIAPSEYIKINKNTFPELHNAYDEIGSLIIQNGPCNQKLYCFPESYPKSLKEWFTVKGGYMKLDRNELNYLLENLSDNELRVYFTFKRIFEANGCPQTGIETWYKVIRETHLKISQNTLKKCIKSLTDLNLISIASPISKESRGLNRFVMVLNNISQNLVSKELRPSFQEIDSKNDQFPENCVHLDKVISFYKENYLNQGTDLVQQEININGHQADFFNFYGLDKLERPLEKKTINFIKKESGLKIEQIQESVKRFSRYYFSHDKIKESIPNPVGLLRYHMKKNKEIFIEPEWWIENQHREYLGKSRFCPPKKENKFQRPVSTIISPVIETTSGLVPIKRISSYFSDMLENIEALG